MQQKHHEIKKDLETLVCKVLENAPNCTLVFITNIFDGNLSASDSKKINHDSQYYSSTQADLVIRSFQSIGFHVQSYFSEMEFIKSMADGSLQENSKDNILVYSAAESGSGSGRRALLPAFCRLNSIPFCGSGPHGCSVARHKYHANAILKNSGINVPKSWFFNYSYGWVGEKPSEGQKIIIKPTYESKSIGISQDSVKIVDKGFDDQVNKIAIKYKQSITIQQFISGYEVAVPIIELDSPVALPITGFSLDGEKYFGNNPRTFEIENLGNRIENFHFNQIPELQYSMICSSAIKAFKALDMDKMARIDMRIDCDGRGYVFDTNEAPPPLSNSSFAFSINVLGLEYIEMLAVWAGISMQQHGLFSS